MVLDAGLLVEYDAPQALLQKEHSLLRALIDESADKDALYAMAEGRTSETEDHRVAEDKRLFKSISPNTSR